MSVLSKGSERRVRPKVVTREKEVGRLFEIILPQSPAPGRFLDIKLDADGRVNDDDLRRAVITLRPTPENHSKQVNKPLE